MAVLAIILTFIWLLFCLSLENRHYLITCERSCILCLNFENFFPNNGQFFSVGDATASLHSHAVHLCAPVPRTVRLMMNLCKTKRLFGSCCLRSQQLLFFLAHSFYLRFSDASGRSFGGRILLLFYPQVACCSHGSDVLACELLIQNCG